MTVADTIAFAVLLSPIWIGIAVRLFNGPVTGRSALLLLIALNALPVIGLMVIFGVEGALYLLTGLFVLLPVNIAISVITLSAFAADSKEAK